MAKNKKTSSAKIFFWIFLGWWLYPFKWLFWDFPKWAIKSSSKKGTKIDGSYVLYGIGILIGIILLISSGSTGAFGVIFGLILICGSGYMIYSKTKKKKSKPEVNVHEVLSSLGIENIHFPEVLENGQKFYKEYDRVEICVIRENIPDFNRLTVNDRLELLQEPENPYDKKAVAVYDNGYRIGYMFRGEGQKMTNDFINRGESVIAFLQAIDHENKKLYMKMAYYKKNE